jgi:hypothetical protein
MSLGENGFQGMLFDRTTDLRDRATVATAPVLLPGTEKVAASSASALPSSAPALSSDNLVFSSAVPPSSLAQYTALSSSSSSSVTDQSMFYWKQDGGWRHISKENVERRYYRCREYAKLGCRAKRIEDRNPTTKDVITVIMKEKHNHDVPSKPPVPTDIKQQAKSLLMSGRTPEQVHRDLVTKLAPSSLSRIPTKHQLANYKSTLTTMALPTHDSIQNLIAVYGGSFLQKLELYPQVMIILFSSSAVAFLKSTSCVFTSFYAMQNADFLM